MPTSWDYSSGGPVAYGIGSLLTQGLDKGLDTYLNLKGAKDALAQKAAELTATQQHQRRLEELEQKRLEDQAAGRAETIQSQKDIHAAEFASKGMDVPETLARPISPELKAQQADYEATAARRGQGEEWKKEMMDLPSQPPEMPGEKPSGFMQPTERITNPFEPAVMSPTSPEYDALRATSQANREKINADQEYKAAVQGAIQELKGEQEAGLQKKKDDAEWSRVVQRGKDQIRASAASGTGRMKMEQDFTLRMANEYRKQHPEFKTDAEAASHLEQLKKFEPVGTSPEAAQIRDRLTKLKQLRTEYSDIRKKSVNALDFERLGLPVTAGSKPADLLKIIDTQISAEEGKLGGGGVPPSMSYEDAVKNAPPGTKPPTRAEYDLLTRK